MGRKPPQESFDNRKWRKPDILNFKVMCVQRDFMMNMEALFSHAYLHREPSAPCQCITCSSELSPGQQGCVCVVCVRACVHECVYILGGLGEVMALMGGAVTRDQEELHGGRSGSRGTLIGRSLSGERCPLLV